MFKTLCRNLVLVAGLVAAPLVLTASPAAADSVRVVIGNDHGVRLAQRFDGRGVCSPGRAVRKAERLGLRRAHVVRANRRTVVVDGFKRGRPVTVRFAQAGGCPIISAR